MSAENAKVKKIPKGNSLISRVMIPMLILGLLEIIIFAAVMIFSGELSYIKKYSYSLLTEKTDNRAGYVENMLSQKTSLVYEASLEVTKIAEEYFNEQGITADSIKTDREVNKEILSRSAETLVSLIRRDMVNDAYIILDTDSLYDTEESTVRAGLYLRDTDIYENSSSDNKDIYMEMGSNDIARQLGSALDSEWSSHLVIDDSNDFRFYTVPMNSYNKYSGQPLYNLGYWTPFSKISFSAQQSMKYTLPLVTSDGKIYGVIGIGIMDKTIRRSIPAADFYNEKACYIIACDYDNSGTYEPFFYSGSSYNRLIGSDTELSESCPLEYNVYTFRSADGGDCLGAIHKLKMYNSGSPYVSQKWALISAADPSAVMNIYEYLIKIFFISAAITILCCIAFSLFTSRQISKPVSKMSAALKSTSDGRMIPEFSSSRITEFDELATSIVKLQQDSLEYAARVSRIITLTDSGIGVFMYSRLRHTVFVSESLTEIMDFEDIPHTDYTVSEEKFNAQLKKIDPDNNVLNLCLAGDPEEFMEAAGKNIEIKSSRSGKEVWYKFSISVLNSDVIGLVQDITETVEEKKRIARYKDDEYTDKLIQANKALRDAYDNARRADNAKTDFLSRMSHDIRTPMNAIIGMTFIANSNIDNKDKVADCLEKITVSGNYLLSLINDVLDMSKIESGKFRLTEDDLNLCTLIDELSEMVAESAKQKKHKLEVRTHDIIHENIVGDRLRIQQVFVNIVSNSIKYTNDGGHITVDITEKPVGNHGVGCYEFVFRDNGIGMTKEFMKKLFEPFERAEDERVDGQQGTGLGMAITYNLVKMMNGSIRVESEPGKGSCFTVTLYLKLSENAETHPEASVEKSADELRSTSFEGRRVLLVDDNELNREIAAELLKMMKLDVECAVNGKEAVDKFAASEGGYYDLIFMDIQMPVMNGYDAVKAIRKIDRSDAEKIPVVAMTANAFAEDVKESLNAGMNEHIAKPLDINKLIATLKKWL